jgi:hypothetical protein
MPSENHVYQVEKHQVPLCHQSFVFLKVGCFNRSAENAIHKMYLKIFGGAESFDWMSSSALPPKRHISVFTSQWFPVNFLGGIFISFYLGLHANFQNIREWVQKNINYLGGVSQKIRPL